MLAGLKHRYHALSPSGRQTFPAHLILALTLAPQFSMLMYASFVMVKTFAMPQWVPVLAATVHVGNMLAVMVADRVQRSDKIAWVVWPNVAAYVLSLLLLPVNPRMGVYFALIVMLMQVCRMPVLAALSAMVKANYRPEVRSVAMAAALCVQMLSVAVYSWIGGRLLDRSEHWLGVVYAATGVIGLIGIWRFSRLRRHPEAARAAAPDPAVRSLSLRSQFSLLGTNPGFRNFELSFMLFGGGNMALATVFPIYLATEFGAGHDQASLAQITLPFLCMVPLLPVWGLLLDRLSPTVLRFRLDLVWMAVPLIYFLAPSIGAVYAGAALLGLLQGGGMLIWNLGVNYYSGARSISVFMGLHQSLTGLRGMAMPFVAYRVGQWLGYRQSMLVWFAMMGLGTLVMWGEIRRERRLGIMGSFAQRERHLAGGGGD